jgi:Ca-activated chloride channel family protein
MSFMWFDFLGLLLLLPILVAIYVVTMRRRRPSGVRYSSLSLIRDAGPGSSRFRRHLPFALFIVALGALVMAMARPVAIVAVPTDQTSIILTIDVSGSMCSSDIPPSRLEAAEAAAAAFIKNQTASARIGIVAFSSYAEVVQAPTNDRAALLAALQTLATGRRTAIGDGILASIDAIAEIDPAVAKSVSDTSGGTAPVPVPKGDYAPDIVVLLTDGANNTGTDPIVAAQQAADRGVRVYTIGFGTANGGSLSPTCAPQFQGREPNAGGGGGFSGGGFGGGGAAGGGGGGGGGGNFSRGIDEVTLQKIADMTGATYHPAETAGQLETVFQNLPTNLIVRHEAAEVSVVFVGVGALLAALALLLGKIWRPLP